MFSATCCNDALTCPSLNPSNQSGNSFAYAPAARFPNKVATSAIVPAKGLWLLCPSGTLSNLRSASPVNHLHPFSNRPAVPDIHITVADDATYYTSPIASSVPPDRTAMKTAQITLHTNTRQTDRSPETQAWKGRVPHDATYYAKPLKGRAAPITRSQSPFRTPLNSATEQEWLNRLNRGVRSGRLTGKNS